MQTQQPPLLKLPNELLVTIIEYLEVHQPQRSPSPRSTAKPFYLLLATSCKRLSDVVRPSIYRDLSFERVDTTRAPAADARIGLYPRRYYDRLNLLLRTWSEHPDYVNYVRSVRFVVAPVYERRTVTSFLDWLTRSTSLEKLAISTLPDTYLETLLGTSPDQVTPFRNLRELSVQAKCRQPFPRQLMTNLFRVPSLEVVHLHADLSEEPRAAEDGQDIIQDYYHMLPALRELCFDPWHFKLDSLQGLLRLRKVQMLRTAEYKNCPGVRLSANLSGSIGNTILCSPTSVQQSLQTLENSATSLHIPSCWFLDHNEDRLDLSASIALKSVDIPSCLLLPVSQRERGPYMLSWMTRQQSIVRLLPPNLEKLCLSFSHEQGTLLPLDRIGDIEDPTILPPWQEYRASANLGSSSSIQDILWWIVDILDNKHDRFPNLQSFSVSDTATTYFCRSSRTRRPLKAFDVVALYPEILKHPEVATSINIKFPSHWSTEFILDLLNDYPTVSSFLRERHVPRQTPAYDMFRIWERDR